ncbi:MAG TPA: DUF2155 domain-containing protein [Acetobacteraceae bacterium]
MRRSLAAALLVLLPAAAHSQSLLLGPAAPAAPTPAPAPAPASPAPEWVPQGSAVLEVLDKVDAVSHDYTVPVGQSVTVESLTIAVQACQAHPPDRPADAAAYLTITDSHPDEPGFKGWMLAAEPWVAMLQSPVYDVRLLRCQP